MIDKNFKCRLDFGINNKNLLFVVVETMKFLENSLQIEISPIRR